MSAGGLRIAVIVPVQHAGRGKSRLAPPFDAEARRALVQGMLADVLAAVRAAHEGLLLVVSPDNGHEAAARAQGAALLLDDGSGYNQAALFALQSEVLRDIDAALILPADLPQLRPEHVRVLLDALGGLEAPGVLLVPSDDGGTAALGLRPPEAMAPVFGVDSARRHRARAHALGLALVEPPLSDLSVDVDTLEDLLEVRQDVGPATARALATSALPALEEMPALEESV
ncbi:MAG: 2-phospho-L-lactate guanylyltransferase [Dehalococcoidia bacterium]|nr:2-phospho-L-lactate guanylyltransferase [Dehalococcoidia bacterium]